METKTESEIAAERRADMVRCARDFEDARRRGWGTLLNAVMRDRNDELRGESRTDIFYFTRVFR